MSWISGRTPQDLFEEATSDKLAGGEQNIALNLDITDLVRSKQFPADQAAKLVRKKLYNVSADVQILTLHLLDLLIKNGGSHFVDEVNTKEFVDAYIAQVLALRNQNRNPEVVELMLDYLQSWALMFENTSGAQIVRGYNQLQSTQGIKFPERASAQVAPSFLQTETAPTWVDSDTCMKSGQAFSMFNRKHHCRNCGGVFVQENCSDFDPLPQYGIHVPVRVCVDCHAKLAAKQGSKTKLLDNISKKKRQLQLRSNDKVWGETQFDKDLQRALEISKNPGQSIYDKPLPPTNNRNAKPVAAQSEEMDEDMRAAIAASLADMERLKSTSKPNSRNTPAQIQEQAQQRMQRNHLVSEKEFSGIQEFGQLLRNAQPHDVIYDPKLLELNRMAQQVQPKLVKELTTTTDKLQLLEDLHGRMMALSGYYDRLLDQELRGHNFAASTPAPFSPQIEMPPSAPSAPAHPQSMNTVRAPASLTVSAPPARSAMTSHARTAQLSSLPSAPQSIPERSSSGSAIELRDSPEPEAVEPQPEPVLIEF